jgi:carboxymethylenebutenolidase
MGGALSLASVASIQGFKAAGVFYGIPDLNIFRLDKITAKVIAHFGRLDPLKGFSDPDSADKLAQDAAKFNYPIKVR